MLKRIDLIDSVRGFCVIGMVIYHFMYDLTAFLNVPSYILYNPIMNFLQVFFAGTFIALCGVSSNLSKNNKKRGYKLALVAIVITIATYFVNNTVYVVFGIIHFLAFCVITYGFVEKQFKKLKLNWIFPVIMLALFIIVRQILNNTVFYIKGLSILGFTNINFVSSDYFPILPWIFLFYLGVYLGDRLKKGLFPSWVYTVKCKLLSKIGKHSLAIYILHQPILMVIIYFLKG